MCIDRERLKEGAASGIHKGWTGFIWVMRIIIPISFFTALLNWSGVIHQLDPLIQPLMGWMGLPGMAALPLLVGFIAGIYSGIAALVVLPFTKAQMTLIAIFMMMAHNLIQEGVIQGKSGIHPLKITLFRLGAAAITVIVCAQFFDTTSVVTRTTSLSAPISEPFLSMLKAWSFSTLRLITLIFVIMIGFLTLLEIIRALGWMDPLVKMLAPILRCLGLSERVGIPWIAGAIFGLVYGAAVIAEEVREGNLTKEDLEGLHLSIGIHHSIIEDPAIFMTFGLSPFWLLVPRFISAMLVVRLFSLWQRFRKPPQA